MSHGGAFLLIRTPSTLFHHELAALGSPRAAETDPSGTSTVSRVWRLKESISQVKPG